MKRIHHEQIARIGQAMASPIRLRALTLLAQRPWRVGELAEELGESVAATSAHLKVLRSVGMVVEERRGRERWCHVESVEIFQLLAAAQRTAETILPELREAVLAEGHDPYVLPSMSLRELAEEIAQGRVALVDLRPSDEYRAGHLPGARSYPFPELDRADLEALRPQGRLVAYCRGRWCFMARQGVQALNERGLPARRLRAGVIDWRAEGLELIQSESDSANEGGSSPQDKKNH